MSARRMLIVDGYNVLRAGEPYASLTERDVDAARARLVSDVAAFVQGEADALVVFDGAQNPSSDGEPHEIAGVHVVFSPYGVDADTVIEKAAADNRGVGCQVTVVTSDAQTQQAVMGVGVTRLSSAGFIAEVTGERIERQELNPSGSRRSTIAERTDTATRETLARWARGER